ncbi:MAG: hypothetical protein ACYDCS_05965 [Candidatus Dormibacteria bacterium]
MRQQLTDTATEIFMQRGFDAFRVLDDATSGGVLIDGRFDERKELADLVSVEDYEVHSGHGVWTLGRPEVPGGPDRSADRGNFGEGKPCSGEARLQGIAESFQRLVAHVGAVLVVEVSVGAEEILDCAAPQCAV